MGKPPAPPAAPIAALTAWFSQLFWSGTIDRVDVAAFIAWPNALTVALSRLRRTGEGSLSINPSALPPMTFNTLIPTPPALL